MFGDDAILLVKRGTAMLVVSADHTADHGTRFDRLDDPVLTEGTVFSERSPRTELPAFSILLKVTSLNSSHLRCAERNVADWGLANRRTIQVVNVSINQRGQIAYLGSR
jgi:hypothetical protein